jgi:hypothetical protein
MEALKKYWTLSPLKFIASSEVSRINPQDFFLHIEDLTQTFRSGPVQPSGLQSTGATNAHVYLELIKAPSSNYPVVIARCVLYENDDAPASSEKLSENSAIYNWGPGYLKNQVQQFSILLESKKKKSLYAPVKNEEKIKELKDQTLYIPDYLIQKNLPKNQSKEMAAKELLKEYKFKYQLIDSRELNNKILDDAKGFYYFLYIKSGTDKYTAVCNSLTGEVIYSKYKPISYDIKTSDFKRLSRLVESR